VRGRMNSCARCGSSSKVTNVNEASRECLCSLTALTIASCHHLSLKRTSLQEVENAKEGGLARNQALEDELAATNSAREVLALALARLLRDTKAQKYSGMQPHDNLEPVADLETQLQRLSMRDSSPSSQCNDFIAGSLAVAHKILSAEPRVPIGALIPVTDIHCRSCVALMLWLLHAKATVITLHRFTIVSVRE
jgi:hypothetical protein